MSDLRTRIAATIQAQWSVLTLTDTWDENCLILADAVIRELGLIEQQSEWPFDGKHRYVTEWKSDDE